MNGESQDGCMNVYSLTQIVHGKYVLSEYQLSQQKSIPADDPDDKCPHAALLPAHPPPQWAP